MQFNYKYSGSSSVKSTSGSTGLSFAPDTLRNPTFFNGKLNKHLPFREAISALHHIVVSDLRYQPKDNTEYLAWVKQQEDLWLAESMVGAEDVAQQLMLKKAELNELRTKRNNIMAPFYKARQEYYNYLYKKNRDLWYVLDPVITVHPDTVFFECFSQDESSYGKLSCNYNVFTELNDFACGTTNIDYSVALYNEFQKIRDYKETSFVIDPSGFEVQTGMDDVFKEVKIDLPDTWVRGFLQVSSAMTLSACSFDLHPMDLNNFLFVLKRNKERKGPRSIRFVLEPGKPVKAIFEPWNMEVVCPRSIYKGAKKEEIRMWGRRRLVLLERLIPIAKKFRVTLLGSGLPSFFEADLGDMTFTLGLSGWTANDWTRASNFDLMMARKEVDALTQQRIYLALKENWFESSASLSKRLNLPKSHIESALSNFIQAGKVVYDLNEKVYRIRELAKDDLPMDQLRFSSPQEQRAAELVSAKKIKLKKRSQKEAAFVYQGKTKENSQSYDTEIHIDVDDKLKKGTCSCRFYKQNKMTQGPCEHMLALKNISR